MISKETLINKYKNDDKYLAAQIIDKICENQKRNKLTYTNFLDLNQYNIAIKIIKTYNCKYQIFNDQHERKSIALLPTYIDQTNFEYIKTLKIQNKHTTPLQHKDYMGALYNIGVNENLIGDIYKQDDHAIVFTIDKITNYLIDNITTVKNNQVQIEEISNQIAIFHNFEEITISANSNRIDLILAKIYNLSRNQINELIKKNNLIINSKIIKNNSYIPKENDIIALKQFGKLKYITNIQKNNKLKITLNKYS